MRTVLAVLAHEGAQKTCDDFMPKWKALGLDMICSVPVGDKIQGFDNVLEIGQSAHRGMLVYKRFLDTLKALVKTSYDRFIVIEYDTVPLRPELPEFRKGVIISNVVSAPHHETGKPINQTCALSPWCMHRPQMFDFIHAADESLKRYGDPPIVCGLLDRWIGHVCVGDGIPLELGFDMYGYPWHPGAHEKIRRWNLNWIHGWKSKEDFQYLWT